MLDRKMKYVIFKSKGTYNPVVFPDHIAHSQIKMDECEVFSSGFIELGHFGIKRVYGRSESLDIGRSELDFDILQKWYLNMGTSSFLKTEIN